MSERQSSLSSFSEQVELADVPLPEALVSDILGESTVCADYTRSVIEEAQSFRDDVRADLQSQIKVINTQSSPHQDIAGVDSSYTDIQGAGVSIGFCSAVSAGDEFHYEKQVFPSPASPDFTTACRGLATMMEMKLITDNRADFTIYDGSFPSALVNLNQMLAARNKRSEQSLWDQIEEPMANLFADNEYFIDALSSNLVVASPKQSSSTFVVDDLYPEHSEKFTDRAFFSMVLKENEYYIHQTPWTNNGSNYGRGRGPGADLITNSKSDRVERFFDQVGFTICFFKPKKWSRAYRLEIPKTRISKGKIERVLRSIQSEVVSPEMIEPYPQWLADSLCKKITDVSNAMRDGVQSQLISEGYNPEEVYSILQGFRTEGR